MKHWDLIIFDCDGVLVDSEPISNGVFAEMAREYGARITNEEALNLFAGTNLGFCMKYVEKQIGKRLPKDFDQQYRKKSFEAFEKELKPVEGIEMVLKDLKYPFCVASNGPKNKVEFNLSNTNLLSYFNGKIFSAYDLKAWKPDPTLFLTAAKHFNAEPEKCLVIEDSLAGVKAGIAANMTVLSFAHGRNIEILKDAGAKTFQKMEELKDLI
jgi:HAD superfamily hydrolase (TIGR01509 family)